MDRRQHVGQQDLDLGLERGEKEMGRHREGVCGEVCICRVGFHVLERSSCYQCEKMNQKMSSLECVASVCLGVQVGSEHSASKWELRPRVAFMSGYLLSGQTPHPMTSSGHHHESSTHCVPVIILATPCISLLIRIIAQQCTWDYSHFKELKNGISELVSGLPKIRQLVSGRISVRVQLSLVFPFEVPAKSCSV